MDLARISPKAGVDASQFFEINVPSRLLSPFERVPLPDVTDGCDETEVI